MVEDVLGEDARVAHHVVAREAEQAREQRAAYESEVSFEIVVSE